MESEGKQVLYGESVTLISLFVAGLAANIPVLIVYLKSKHIRSITDKFLLNLLIADFISLVILLPSILVTFIRYSVDENVLELNQEDTFLPSSTFVLQGTDSAGLSVGYKNVSESFSSQGIIYWNWSCIVNKGLLSGVATASVLAALEIALERYLAVVTPLHYHKFLTTPSIFLVSFIGGVISLASAMISAIDPSHSVFPTCFPNARTFVKSGSLSHDSSKHQHHEHFDPDLKEHTILDKFDGIGSGSNDEIKLSWKDEEKYEEFIWAIYNLIHILLVFIIPLILMTFIYVRIYIEARRQKIQMTQRYKPYFLPDPSDQTIENPKGKSRFDPIFIKFRLMDRLRAPRVDRAARVAVFTLFVTLLCWTPYYSIKGMDAILKIMVMSGSQLSLKGNDGVDPEDYQSSWYSFFSSGSKWGSVYPLLFASLHPLLAPIFYAYRYKRLRTEIMKTVFDLISSCSSHDNHSTSCVTTSRLTNKGFSTSSTYGGSPCIRQTISIPAVVTPISQLKDSTATTNIQNITAEIRPIIIVSKSNGDEEEFISIPVPIDDSRDLDLKHSNISIQIDCVEDEGICDLVDVAHEMRDQESPLSLRRQNSIAERNESTGGVVRMEKSVGNFVNCLTVWMNSYSRRWLQHRESVTSTASFITLLSSKYHNKTQPVANV